MGTRGAYALVDTTPAKTILVYRNGDQFYVGKKFVFTRRRVANFEVLLEQLTEQVEVPFGVRRLYTPTRGHQVHQLEALQMGGKYVAAGREPFKKLDYIHIVPRKPMKMKKFKEIKPVVHCDINVPSKWHTFHGLSRHINVFTNGRLLIPPVKIIIPKFTLMDWENVLAVVGEKVFPLGGVRKKCAEIEKHSRRKKKENLKGKELHKHDSDSSKLQDSVYYAKEEKKQVVERLIQSGAEGDVYKAQTPNIETQGAPVVIEDQEVKVEVPVDETPAEIVKEDKGIDDNTPDSGSNKEKEEEDLHEDNERQEDNSRMYFKKKFPLRHNTKKKATLKNFSKNKKMVTFPEKEPNDILEEKNTPVLLETQGKLEEQRETPMEQQSQEDSATQLKETPKLEESLQQSNLGQPFQGQIRHEEEPSEQFYLGKPSQELIPYEERSIQSLMRQPSSRQILDQEEQPSLGQPSQEQISDEGETFAQQSMEQPFANRVSTGSQTPF
ncbi:doublecortin domain-containing protein 2C isoform X2 [Erinaceus europaeus]|uniref:Doublecortin domain-containing protein 2C isoform X2 n=1 Tax=Erinaceus europaeus TaxID=9365 RepID=A0ABM3X2H3_ERIEU|nr:doublecortin domain-containing protein 2C isoform X2 [Erinaceus europaeus]